MQKYCHSVAVHIDLSQCHGARITNGVNTIKLIQTLCERDTEPISQWCDLRCVISELANCSRPVQYLVSAQPH